MDQLTKSNLFEKIIIKDPSVITCAWLLVQLVILGQYFDKDYNPSEHANRTTFQHWYGFWVFAPTYAFYLFLVVYITVEQAGSTQAITRVFDMVAPRRGGSNDYQVMSSDVLVFQDLSMNADTGTTLDSSSAPSAAEINDDHIDGYKMTPQDFARESSLNRSLINKVLWTFPSFFLASCKISFDTHDHYSWHLILTPLYIYVSFLLFVGYTRQNWFMHSQREIDIEERRIQKNLTDQRIRTHTQISQSQSSVENNESFDF